VNSIAHYVQPEPGVALQGKSGVLFVNVPLNRGHLLDLFDLRGRRVVRVRDPFTSGSRYALPMGVSGGAYVAQLSVLGSREPAVVFGGE